MDIGLIGLAFVSIFLVELPDKTFLAGLVLSTKYRPLLVWLGMSLAFLVQTLIAVSVGGVATLLPDNLIHTLAGLMFLVGAVWLYREALHAGSMADAEAEEASALEAKAKPAVGSRQVLTAFLVIFASEWGDLSQLLTISMVAKYHHVVSIFLGSVVALIVVSGIAAAVGKQLLRFISLRWLHIMGGTLCLVLGVYTLAKVIW